jgi:predicted kinase
MKNVQFLLLRGLPGSGKSTYAATLVKEGWKRINKDMLREMIDGGEFSPENEAQLNNIIYRMAAIFLRNGYSVISDNMNWNPYHFQEARNVVRSVNNTEWGDFEESIKATLTVKDFDIPIEVCIKRDAERAKPVTEEVIRKIADQWIVNGKWPDISRHLGWKD